MNVFSSHPAPRMQSNGVERDLFLRSLGMGRPVGDAVGILGRIVTPLSLRAGQTLYQAGAAPTALYYVVSGSIELQAAGHSAWTFGPRDTIGVHDLFLERSRARTAVAATDADLYAVRSEDYLDVLEENRDFTQALLSTVCAGLVTMSANLPPTTAFGVGALLDRALLLRSCPAFCRARVQPLLDLAGTLTVRSLSRGMELAESEGAPSIALLASGSAEAVGRVPVRYAPGSILGGYASLHTSTAPGVRMLEDAVVAQVRQEDLLAVMDDHFDLARSLLAGIAFEREAARGTVVPSAVRG